MTGETAKLISRGRPGDRTEIGYRRRNGRTSGGTKQVGEAIELLAAIRTTAIRTAAVLMATVLMATLLASVVALASSIVER